MTKGEAIDAALRWMDEATVGGSAADNGEIADYRDRMATLLDSVIQLLGSQFRLHAQMDSPSGNMGWALYELPEDFLELDQILLFSENGVQRWTDYRWVGERELWVQNAGTGTFRFSYFRMPEHLSANAAENTVLDCHPLAQTLVPLKLAADAMSGMEEKAELSAYLENKFSAMLQSMLPDAADGFRRVETIYEVSECI